MKTTGYLMLMAGLWLSACSSEPEKPKNYGKVGVGLQAITGKRAAQPPPPVEPPSTPPEELATGDLSDIAYAYSPIGKRDPFRSLYDELSHQSSDADLTPLQTFEIDQLRLVGIVSRIATPYAMVEDPTSKGHTLRRGTLIGKNWGRVSQIQPDCVIIKEEYRDYTGRKVTNKTSMCLPEPSELKFE